MSLINSIATTYKGNPEFYKEVTDVVDKSRELEEVLTSIIDNISYASYLTGRKNVDIELLLQIVASYVLGIEQGELDPEDTPPPKELFENSLFPSLEKVDTEVIVEKEYDGNEEDDSRGSSGTTQEVGSE